MQCRSNQTISGMLPQMQYANQRVIWGTVGVDARMYTDALAALTVWETPLDRPQVVERAGAAPYWVPAGVRWNQMSDRAVPSGSAAGHARGQGVDVKHGSYERYLLKLKGRGPLRRGPIPADYGAPRPLPVRGGKTVKTSIVNGKRCGCAGGGAGDVVRAMTDEMRVAMSLCATPPVAPIIEGATVRTRARGAPELGRVAAVEGDRATVELRSGYTLELPLQALVVVRDDVSCQGRAMKRLRRGECGVATAERDKYIGLQSAEAKAKALCALLDPCRFTNGCGRRDTPWIPPPR